MASRVSAKVSSHLLSATTTLTWQRSAAVVQSRSFEVSMSTCADVPSGL